MIIKQRTKHIATAMLAILCITSLGLASVLAQTATTTADPVNPLEPVPTSTPVPGGDDGIGEIGPLGITSELETARNAVWNALLNDSDNPLSVALHSVQVLLSGVMEIDGEEVLYIGVDEEDYEDDEKMNALKKELEERFPDIPVYIQATEGVHLQQSAEPLMFKSEPRKAIPDNADQQSVESTINIPTRSGELSTQVIDDIQVTVDITHDYIGDLKVDLVTPGGAVVVLHNRIGGNTRNINRTYNTQLDGLVGTNMSGNWKLRVGDYTYSNTGTLNAWSIKVKTRNRGATGAASTVIFSDDFASGLGKWTVQANHNDTGWRATVHTEGDAIYGFTTSNIVAEAEECDAVCVITTTAPINLTNYDKAYLSFDRWVDNSIDIHEYLRVEVSNDGGTTYRQLDEWTISDSESSDKWNHEEYILTNADLRSTNFKVRFTTKQSSPSEQTAVDNVLLSSVPNDGIATTVKQDNCAGAEGRSGNISIMGGDRIFSEIIDGDNTKIICSTLTVGGVHTRDGRRGFVMSAHAIDPENLRATKGLIAGELDSEGDGKRFLGKVSGMPFVWKENLKGDSEKESVILADAAFVEEPYSNDCLHLVREEAAAVVPAPGGTSSKKDLCFGYEYVERVEAKRIRGERGSLYTVTGVEVPVAGDRIRVSGAAQGEIAGSTISSGRVIGDLLFTNGASGVHSYVFVYTGSLTQDGDSGAPVYTEPNAENEVEIVGLHVGTMKHPAREVVLGVFNAWRDVAKTLNLAPLDANETEEEEEEGEEDDDQE